MKQMALFKTLVPHKASLSKLSSLCKWCIHISRYQQPNQYNLPAPDLGLIISKCRFLTFHEDMKNPNSDINTIDTMKNGSHTGGSKKYAQKYGTLLDMNTLNW
eukprot:116073_1